MPLKGEAKRRYDRERLRLKRGYYVRHGKDDILGDNRGSSLGVGGEYERGKGGRPDVVPVVPRLPYHVWRFHKRLVEKNELLQDTVTTQGKLLRGLQERILRLETDQVLREALDDRTGLGYST